VHQGIFHADNPSPEYAVILQTLYFGSFNYSNGPEKSNIYPGKTGKSGTGE
jgi:hypothetical protein